MRTWVTLVCGLGILAGLTGCMSMGSSLAASSVPIEGRQYAELGPTSGSASCFYLFGIFDLSDGETSDAHQRAIEAAGADGLVSVAVDNVTIPTLVGTRYITKVQGTAIKFTD